MIKVPYADIVAKIKESTNLSDDDIKSKIKDKMDQLAGLISKEGAAHIVANELGVKIFDAIEGKMKINKILGGMRSVEISGKITNIFETREFTKQDGTKGKVASLIVADETGSIRVALWNDQADKIKGTKSDSTVQIKDAYVKEGQNGRLELHLGSKAQIILNPEGVSFGQVATAKTDRKKISEIAASDTNVEIMGTIVQAFEPRFYEVCPNCSKRVKQKDSQFVCQTHGEIIPAYAYVLNLVLDDGTGTIRTVFFRNQLLSLLQSNQEDILKFKDNPQEFDPIKEELVGNIIKIVGRISNNEMFGRLELVAQLVYPNPDPDEELKKLEKEAEIIE